MNDLSALPATSRWRLFANVTFAVILAANTISAVGDAMYDTSISWPDDDAGPGPADGVARSGVDVAADVLPHIAGRRLDRRREPAEAPARRGGRHARDLVRLRRSSQPRPCGPWGFAYRHLPAWRSEFARRAGVDVGHAPRRPGGRCWLRDRHQRCGLQSEPRGRRARGPYHRRLQRQVALLVLRARQFLRGGDADLVAPPAEPRRDAASRASRRRTARGRSLFPQLSGDDRDADPHGRLLPIRLRLLGATAAHRLVADAGRRRDLWRSDGGHRSRGVHRLVSG